MEKNDLEILAQIGQLFLREGIEVEEKEGVLVLNKRFKLTATLSNEDGKLPENAINLEVVFWGENLKKIKESFTGIGRNRLEAASNAVVYFEQALFYVLLDSFLEKESEWVTKERWQMDGGDFMVRIGRPVVRGEQEVVNQISLGFFNQLEEAIKAREWQEDTNWISVFFGKKSSCHLNNNSWTEGREILERSEHPNTEKYYSLRFFMTMIEE